MQRAIGLNVNSKVRALIVVGLLGSVLVLAQPSPSPPAAASKGNDESEPDPKEADAILTRMRTVMQKGLDEVTKAREDKDNVRLLCINEPVAAMKGVLRISENSSIDLQTALASNEPADARREFRKVKQGGRQMDNLLSLAQNCKGVSSTESTTSVEVEVDPNLLALDPYYGSDSFFYDPAGDLIADNNGGLGTPDPLTVRPPNASGIL